MSKEELLAAVQLAMNNLNTATTNLLQAIANEGMCAAATALAMSNYVTAVQQVAQAQQALDTFLAGP